MDSFRSWFSAKWNCTNGQHLGCIHGMGEREVSAWELLVAKWMCVWLDLDVWSFTPSKPNTWHAELPAWGKNCLSRSAKLKHLMEMNSDLFSPSCLPWIFHRSSVWLVHAPYPLPWDFIPCWLHTITMVWPYSEMSMSSKVHWATWGKRR